MLGPTKVAVSFVLVALSLMMEGKTTNANPNYQISLMPM